MRPTLLAAALIALAPLAEAALPESVAARIAAAGIPDSAVGAIVLKGGQVVLEHNARQPLQPASTMKLVTTMVALDTFGPVFRFRTELRSNAEIVGSTLKGDLYIKGGADWDLDLAALESMLQSLRNQGIRRIDGQLVYDRQLWQPTRYDLGPAFDEAPEAYYNLIPDALLVNHNMLEIDMRSTASRLNLALAPALEGVSIGHDMELVTADCAKWENGWKIPTVKEAWTGKQKITLHGSFPKNCARSYGINVLDHQAYADHAVRGLWRRLGGSIKGESIEGRTPEDAKLLAAHRSRVLPELLRDTNKDSDNALARLLYLSLGSLAPDPVLGSKPLPASEQSTPERAERAIRAWFQAHGIDDSGMVLENGSGLSRNERLSVAQLAAILQEGQRSLWAPEFLTSLPIAGVDGTLKRRLGESAAAQRARMKTGTLRNTVGLAGYVPDTKGEPQIVVMIVNDDKVGNGVGRAILDSLADWAARQ
ncbi:D-alanyl-D-alanine carboxypeptidase/D-alanyl-D-alanine-endopeptidase [Massilia sp. TS11]|uniref:D-alanyl-D-alanine carboxypeptidase/D-alanyl-D-alanine endopeptidase n=1 Tax=Massilia sp. TS11 TaxID=2908003 RepID=UPI001ED9CA6F|nr:D-alanyl-D-alanine carboxypeptidase/D-alanyl-D-alanine-endopeptidase [Massilia sp. TS11]MCG2585154.1 D-alanyl-D-alanine carboxypeptidase/D-alanyl-D-alanine-endopeptidase [Massilia sp. TS11]